MKRHTAIFISTALLGINMACSYSESGIYYVEPIADNPATIMVSTNLDTVILPVLTDSLEIQYDVDIENGEFYQLETFYQEELIFSGDTIHGSFIVKPRIDQLPGIDTLRLYFFYSTNSNSLADLVNLEADYVTLDYALNYEGGGEK